MNEDIKTIIRNLTPPIFLKIFFKNYQNRGEQYGLFGNYSSWEEARKASSGYDSDIILNKVKDSLLKVKNGEAVYERDSVLFDKIQYSWPLLAGLLWIASQNSNKLNFVDFGGSLGSLYFQNRRFLAHLKELRWNIVEQQKFVECGKCYFENEHLNFYYSLDECVKEQNPETILLSGVIQYIEKPYSLLEEVIKNIGFKYVIFDRTFFFEKGNDRLMVQKVTPMIYDASYPAWIFNLDRFLIFFSDKYELLADFDGLEKANINAKYKGFIFRRKNLP